MTSTEEHADEVSPTDKEILRVLADGKETRGSLADKMERSPHYIGERIELLRLRKLIVADHAPTALYRITEDGQRVHEVVSERDDGSD